MKGFPAQRPTKWIGEHNKKTKKETKPSTIGSKRYASACQDTDSECSTSTPLKGVLSVQWGAIYKTQVAEDHFMSGRSVVLVHNVRSLRPESSARSWHRSRCSFLSFSVVISSFQQGRVGAGSLAVFLGNSFSTRLFWETAFTTFSSLLSPPATCDCLAE